MNIAVFGAGKLGSPMAAFFASAGYDVSLIDRNRMFVESVKARRAPVEETGLQKLFDDHGHRISGVFWEDATAACQHAEFIFVIVPTPSLENGSFSNEFLKEAVIPIGAAIANHSHPTVVITSTVSPGAMSGVILPHIEKLAGTCAGAGFDLVYNPEFIALGSVLENMRRPDFLLIGSDIPDAGSQLAGFYRNTYTRLRLPMPPVALMNYVNAEISKLAVNCYTTTKISFANGLADLCEHIPDADAKIVCDAIGLDTRIGKKYLNPATAFGGPCFPRDCRAMLAAGDAAGVACPIPEATDNINYYQIAKLKRLVMDRRPKSIAILGLAYKTDTSVTEESAAVRLVKKLCENNDVDGCQIRVHDPMARWSEYGVKTCATAKAAIADAEVVVIATNWKEYAGLMPADFSFRARIIDCWRMLDAKVFAEEVVNGVELIVPGRNMPPC